MFPRVATKAKEDVHLKTLKALVLIAVVLTTGLALAANLQVNLNNPSQLNGTTISPGSYKLNYNTTGNTAQVNVIQGKKLWPPRLAKLYRSRPRRSTTAS